MKLQYVSLFMLLVAIGTFGIELKILYLEKCYGNEKFIVIRTCEILNKTMFDIRAYIVTHVDSIIVSISD